MVSNHVHGESWRTVRVNRDDPGTIDLGDQTTAIEVSGISKSFSTGARPEGTLKERLISSRRASSDSSFTALSEVTFGVATGETFGILGHNGSGKSTLLKLIAGTLMPTAGRIRTRGRLSALLELGAGFHPDLTGRENVYLNASILGIPKPRVTAIFADIVEFAELQDFIDLQVKYYSSGMMSRLGFAVATNLDPDVLLIDEVLAVGDEAFQAKCMERIFAFKQLRNTMVIVSHATEQVRMLCDRVAVLDKGHLLYVGDPDEAIDVYRAALYGDGAANETGKAAEITVETPEIDTDVTITSVAMLSHRNGATLSPGDTLRVAVGFSVRAPIEHNIRLLITTLDGAVMSSRSVFDTNGHSLPGVVGENEVRFEFGPLPLLDGDYQLTVQAESLDTATVHHRVTSVAEFHISGPGSGYGRVDMPTICSVKHDHGGPAAPISASPLSV